MERCISSSSSSFRCSLHGPQWRSAQANQRRRRRNICDAWSVHVAWRMNLWMPYHSRFSGNRWFPGTSNHRFTHRRRCSLTNIVRFDSATLCPMRLVVFIEERSPNPVARNSVRSRYGTLTAASACVQVARAVNQQTRFPSGRSASSRTVFSSANKQYLDAGI